jgi:hypothetical protein
MERDSHNLGESSHEKYLCRKVTRNLAHPRKVGIEERWGLHKIRNNRAYFPRESNAKSREKISRIEEIQACSPI